MKKTITSGILVAVAMLGMVSPAFATTTYTYPPVHASSTIVTHTITTVSTTTTNTGSGARAKTVLLVGSVSQNSGGILTVLVKTKTYTVTVGSKVLIYSKTGKMLTLSDIKAGDQIRVRGLAKGTQVAATSMRDLSL